MRGYGRFVKNIAGLLLLLAVVSLLFPFCHVPVPRGELTLSGWDILSAGGKTGAAYLTDGSLSDEYVVKAPYTWGEIRTGLQFVVDSGLKNQVIFGIVLALLPVIFTVLGMLLTFLADGKKVMFLATLFTFLAALEVGGIFVLLPAIHSFLLVGWYLFLSLTVAALVLMLLGWITGGYLKPKKGKERKGRRRPRKKTRRKKSSRSRKKRSKRQKKETEKAAEPDSPGVPEGIEPGMVQGGSGIYRNLEWNLCQGTPMTTIGTTAEAMESILREDWQNMSRIADQNCLITYESQTGSYQIVSHSLQDISLWQQGKQMPVRLVRGDSINVPGGTTVVVGDTDNYLHLR